ncbi:hypothetical protein MNV49_004216 [Pseudohyphozyma bogoriensis]|nr:hypothetical protein MNV49_004216 [Pseudohyphozyma bogoriensis]
MSSPSPSTGSPPQKKLKLVDTRSELDAELDEERGPPTQSDDAGDEQEQGWNSTPNDDEEAKGTDPCPITKLPLKLLDKITSRMAWNDLVNLAATCRGFRNLYRLPAILEKLDDDKYKWSLYCVEGAQKGEFGFEPFIIFSDNCRVERDDSGWSSDEWTTVDSDSDDDDLNSKEDYFASRYYLLLDVLSVPYEEFYPDRPTKDYFLISQDARSVQFDWELFFDLSLEKYEALIYNSEHGRLVAWDELDGNLQIFTPAIARARFTCPECRDSEDIMAGTPETLKRWPRLSVRFFSFEVDCPRCRLPYDSVVKMVKEIEDDVLADVERAMP